MTETEWRFDAIRDDPLTALRIPVVRSPYPDWNYEVCLLIGEPDRFGPDGLYGPALRPDEAETRQIVAYIEYRMAYYNEGWKAKMRKRPLDIDATTNTVVLVKRREGDWQYRRCSWQYGPLFVGTDEGLTLVQCLDRVNGHGNHGEEPNPKWEAHKAAHPEAFPPAGEDDQS